MLTKFKPKSEFSRNVLTLMTGTTIAQAIPIAISPILTRIYTPEDFGLFSIYTSITLILGVIICGRYELAIMLPKYKKYSESVFFLSIIISVIFSLILLMISFVFTQEICNLLNIDYTNFFWLYLIPVSTLLTGIYQSLYYLNNKNKQYKTIAKSRVIQNFSLSFISVTLGKIGFNFLGLLLGNLFGQIISVIYLFFSSNYTKLQINKSRIIILSKKYSSLPKYDILASLSSISSHQLLPILFSIYYSPIIAGYVYLMQRVISSPVNLISSAVLDVFKEKASQDYTKLNNAKSIYKSTFKKLFIISFIPSIILYFYSVDIFIIIFGESWLIAGEYAKYMIPMLFFRFISNPLSFMFYIVKKEHINLIMQVILLLAIILSFVISNNEMENIILISMIFSVFYILQILFSAKYARIF